MCTTLCIYTDMDMYHVQVYLSPTLGEYSSDSLSVGDWHGKTLRLK